MMRESGVLLHITSLPSPFGIGDLGPVAYKFADLLAKSRQRIWQINPINPTLLKMGSNPYDSPSAFAGNTLLIDPLRLVEMGLLDSSDVEDIPAFPDGATDYPQVTNYKEKLFGEVYGRFKDCGFGDADEGCRYAQFCTENSAWLEDYCLFVACKDYYRGRVWNRWPSRMRDRDEDALANLRHNLCDRIDKEKLLQYIFFRQWFSLMGYCNRLRIRILGDMPIYVSYDSADVWANSHIFNLDRKKRPLTVSGVPPDQFSETGQLWGNPTYRWDALKEENYSWFIRRMEHNLRLFDLLRIDHFRGLVAYWAVKAGSKTASKGRWIDAPAEDFLTELYRRFSRLPIIAEDLGHITADVREVVSKFEIPGMRVFAFAFEEDIACSCHIPHNFVRNCIAYTGTHDTNTARGWFEEEATPEDKERLFCYLGREVTAEEVSWELIRLAILSVADTVITPMQDLLSLGAEARMNRPATTSGNYRWRLLPEQMRLDRRLKELTEISGRA
jgi:4-alpha-glucanotransferase